MTDPSTKTKTADVWVNDVFVGRLVGNTHGVTTFTYDEDYLRNGGRRIATTLPIDGGPAQGKSGALPPFFTGLLPEGRRLSALKRSIKASLDDELSLLLAVGGNTVGNVFVLPEGQKPEPAQPMVDVRAGKGNYAELIDDDAEFDRQALAGVQEKASARTIALPIKGNAILKLSPKEFPGLVENEATCLAAYRTMPSARGKVVRSAVVEDSNRVSGLVLERFDGSFPHKHAVEDASQLLGIYPGAKYDVSYEQLCEAVLNVVASPLMAARGLAQQLAFAWLSGNGDLHAKNISVMDAGRGFELTPVYDIPSTVPYGDNTLALPVQGSTEGLSYKRFHAFCDDMGIPEHMARTIAEEVLQATDNLVAELIAACDFDPRRARDLERVLAFRRRHW